MSMELKEAWMEVGRDLGRFAKDLGRSTLRTLKAGAQLIDEWIDEDGNPKRKPKKTPTTEKTAAPIMLIEASKTKEQA